MEDAKAERPAVSVIVPIYNSASTLRRCLESLVAQSFKDFELILVDDGSTDGSLRICREYADADPRIKVFSQANGGVSAARNLGLSNASGDYVAFCDSDDMVREFWLSSMMSVSGKAGLAVCGYDMYRPESDSWTIRTLGHTEIFTDDDELIETLLREQLLQYVWNKLFSMKVIRENSLRFEETFSIFEDEYFVLGYIRHIRSVICIPEHGYRYWLPENFIRKYDFGIEAFMKVVEMIYSIVGDTPGKLHLPSIVYWYKVALARYASSHTYKQTKEYMAFARKLAVTFHGGPLNHLTLRYMPPGLLYLMLKLRAHGIPAGK